MLINSRSVWAYVFTLLSAYGGVCVGEEGHVLDQRIADTTPLTLAMRIEACSTGRRFHHPVLTAVPATTVAARR